VILVLAAPYDRCKRVCIRNPRSYNAHTCVCMCVCLKVGPGESGACSRAEAGTLTPTAGLCNTRAAVAVG